MTVTIVIYLDELHVSSICTQDRDRFYPNVTLGTPTLELDATDMTITIKKSCCIDVGHRHNVRMRRIQFLPRLDIWLLRR